jgi:hypothetical protein
MPIYLIDFVADVKFVPKIKGKDSFLIAYGPVRTYFYSSLLWLLKCMGEPEATMVKV